MNRVVMLAVLGLGFASTVQAAEPDALGTFTVVRNEYGLGDTAFVPPSLGAPVELRGVIHSPDDLGAGPFPLVVVLHGRHVTCYQPGGDPQDNTSGEWPCEGGHQPIPSYLGYEYWAENLASHGYVVVSIGANGINAADDSVDDGGARARAELVAAHLELWQAFNDTDEYGTAFNDSVDLDNVGLVGHSRGGEGVAAFVPLDAERNLPYTVRALLLLAPTDFNRIVVAGVPLGVIVPYCDGDVFDLQGAHYYDDARHAVAGDPSPKYLFEMSGSNHNFFNTVWSPGGFAQGGATDDFADLETFVGPDPACGGDGGSTRLTEPEQQASYVAYANAFFRTHLGGETDFAAALRGAAPSPASSAPAAVNTSYMPADLPSERLVVNRVASSSSLQTNDLGAAVTSELLADYGLCGVGADGGIEGYDHCVNDPGMFMGDLFEGREPHVPGLAHLRLRFAAGATWTNELPEGTDVSGYRALSFRGSVDFEAPQFAGEATFDVALIDRAGVRATASARAWSDGLAAPVGNLYPVVPKLLMHGIRIPLEAFVTDGGAVLDTTDLAAIELSFDGGAGAVLLSDLAFVDAVPPEPGTTGTSGSEGPASTSSEGGTIADDSSSSGVAATTAVDGTSGTGADGTTTNAESSGGDDGCGCDVHRDPPYAALAWVALGLRRRRRAITRTVD